MATQSNQSETAESEQIKSITVVPHRQNVVWQIMPGGNRCLYAADESFYISFQGNPNNPFGNADTDDGETAICVSNQYFILNGDYRREYEELVPKGLTACIYFYIKHQDRWSSYSNELPQDKMKGIDMVSSDLKDTTAVGESAGNRELS